MPFERWLYAWRARWRALFDRGRVDRELDDELRDHVARETAALRARGMAPAEARAPGPRLPRRSRHGAGPRGAPCASERSRSRCCRTYATGCGYSSGAPASPRPRWSR